MAEFTKMVEDDATADGGSSFSTPDDGRLKNERNVANAHFSGNGQVSPKEMEMATSFGNSTITLDHQGVY